jgi:cytochrome P450
MDAISGAMARPVRARFFACGYCRIIAKRRANPSAHHDLLDLLLAARDADTGRGMNDAELVANLLTFISAGHETTAVALTWTLWLLAKDEAVQWRVYDESKSPTSMPCHLRAK